MSVVWRATLVFAAATIAFAALASSAEAIAPSLGFDVSAPGNSANHPWYNVAVVVTFHDISWDDPIMGGIYGIAAVTCSRDGGAPVAVVPTSTLALSQDGQYEVVAQGTWGGFAHPVDFALDSSAPSSTCDAKPTYVGAAVVSITASDAVSGPAAVRYALDAAAPDTIPVSPSAPTALVHAGVGTHHLSWEAVDLAGNAEPAWHEVAFQVSPAPPKLGKPRVSLCGRRATVTGALTPLAQAVALHVAFERWWGGRWHSAVTLAVPLRKGARSWRVTRTLSHRGRYRVRALGPQGSTSTYTTFGR